MKCPGVTGKMKACSWPRDGLFCFLGSNPGVPGVVESLEEIHIRVGIDCIHSTLNPHRSPLDFGEGRMWEKRIRGWT